MHSLNSWIYVDYTNNIWKLSVNGDKELLYTIMYKEGKWTKEKLIDKDVLGFYVYADEEGIHIIYSNINAELKYCTFIGQQWMGKTLFKLDSKEVEIEDLKAIIIGNEIHIFYLVIDKYSDGHGIIMHCRWNGKETKIIKLQDVILESDLSEYYLVYSDETGNIELIFLSDEGNEISLNYCSFKNKRWTPAIRLYGISGDNFVFKMLKDQYGIHILNKCKEDSVYYLDHVFVKKNGNVQKLSVHESVYALAEPILFKKQNKMYSCWLEENKVYFSVFNGILWDGPSCLMEDNEHDLKKYNYCSSIDKDNSNVREVYVIDNLNFDLINPSQLAAKSKEKLIVNQIAEKREEINKAELLQKDSNYKKLKSELARIKSENNDLEQTIASLNMQLQKKQNMQEEYEEKISQILHYKQKADENYNIFLELQQKMQSDLAELNRRLEEEKSHRDEIEKKYIQSEEERLAIKEQIDTLTEENNRLNKELELEKNQSVKKRFWKL